MGLRRVRKKVRYLHDRYSRMADNAGKPFELTAEMSRYEAWIYVRGVRDGLNKALGEMER